MFDVREHVSELLDPACYPNRPRSVELVETLISTVFLAGDTVYKLKKPVDFGFVNYSTVAARRRYCELEVSLNRRLSSRVYLDSVPLVRTPQGMRFEAPGRPVDWAVTMQRVPEATLWSNRLAAGTLGRHEMEQLAGRLSGFHAAAPANRGRSPLLAADRAWVDNLHELRRFAGSLFPTTLLDELDTNGQARRTALDPLLRRRLREGRFVDGHGDLRLEHLCVLDGELQALDCIEFSRSLREVDGASDLAFLLMDLDRNGRAALSLDLAAYYLRASGDATLPLCDRYYRAHRALVRAKVDALAQQNADLPAERVNALRERCGRLVQLAAGYLRPRPRPALIIVRGVSGTGKTTLATRLAADQGLAWLASDYVRKQSDGTVLSSRLPAAAYTPAARRAVYGQLHRAVGRLLRQGFPVLLDATYLDPAMQAAAAATARRHGVPALVLTLRLQPAVLRARIQQRAAGASDATWQVAREQIERFGDTPFTGLDEVIVDAAGEADDVFAAAAAVARPLLYQA